MNPLKTFCLLACLATVAFAVPSQKTMAMRDNTADQKLKPTQWLSVSQLESAPSINDVTLERLETMPAEEGAFLIRKLYHLSQINHDLTPSFVPSPSSINVYLIRSNGEKITTSLSNLAETLQQEPNFGNEEVTMFITGLPQTSLTVKKATKALVEAYIQRYNGLKPQPQNNAYQAKENQQRTSSEEDYSVSWKEARPQTGNLIVIDLGSTLTSFKRYAMLDIEETGAMIGKALVKMTNEFNVPHEIIHIVAQGIAAHVAGAAGNEYTRLTGHKLRRITALDPSRIYARNPAYLTGLARGDADFVDAIHTSVYGMGSPMRVGDVDFFPDGPSVAVSGATNVVEASMRATRYYAETVRPGNERNFPAVPANSLNEYKNNNGMGRRAYMGIDTDYDLEGDYMLQVNANSPFGRSTPAQKQMTYHGMRQSWKNE